MGIVEHMVRSKLTNGTIGMLEQFHNCLWEQTTCTTRDEAILVAVGQLQTLVVSLPHLEWLFLTGDRRHFPAHRANYSGIIIPYNQKSTNKSILKRDSAHPQCVLPCPSYYALSIGRVLWWIPKSGQHLTKKCFNIFRHPAPDIREPIVFIAEDATDGRDLLRSHFSPA